VVESSFGYHIIKVTERRGARTAPITEASTQIKEFLTGQQREAKILAFVERAKTKRKIEILV
jgi:foldase protein PrsA